MGYLIIATCVAVWLLYGWRLSISLLDAEIRERVDNHPNLYGNSKEAARFAKKERANYLAVGFLLALFWPVTALSRGLYRLAIKKNALTTPTEIKYAEREELERLRKVAREYGLPL